MLKELLEVWVDAEATEEGDVGGVIAVLVPLLAGLAHVHTSHPVVTVMTILNTVLEHIQQQLSFTFFSSSC